MEREKVYLRNLAGYVLTINLLIYSLNGFVYPPYLELSIIKFEDIKMRSANSIVWADCMDKHADLPLNWWHKLIRTNISFLREVHIQTPLHYNDESDLLCLSLFK